MDVILCFFHWIPKGAVRSWRSLPRCSDRRAVRGGLRSSPCPSVFSSPPRRRGVPRRWWLVLIVVFVFIARVFCFCFVHSRADAITRWHRLTPSRGDTAWRRYEMTSLPSRFKQIIKILSPYVFLLHIIILDIGIIFLLLCLLSFYYYYRYYYY